MRRTVLLFLVCAVAALVIGCAEPMRFQPLQGCNGAECGVDVDVSGGCPGDANVDPPTLEVPANVKAQILWRIKPASSGYSFDPTDGITFPVNPNVFDDKKPVNGAKAFHWRDNNDTSGSGGSYKYVVRVIRPDGTACTQLDPFIHNN